MFLIIALIFGASAIYLLQHTINTCREYDEGNIFFEILNSGLICVCCLAQFIFFVITVHFAIIEIGLFK